jgi:chromatin remodeling complex protein RSC6
MIDRIIKKDKACEQLESLEEPPLSKQSSGRNPNLKNDEANGIHWDRSESIQTPSTMTKVAREELKEKPSRKWRRNHAPKGYYDYSYKLAKTLITDDQVAKGEVVKLYPAGDKYVHPDEKRHVGIHSHFCRVNYCPYHN